MPARAASYNLPCATVLVNVLFPVGPADAYRRDRNSWLPAKRGFNG